MEPHSHERSELPVTAQGRLKVTDWVIGTLPDREAAHACTQTLVSAGFADDDVLVESPSSALQQLRAEETSESGESRLVQMFHTVEDVVSGMGSALHALYVAEATAGRWLAGAHDAQQTTIIDSRAGILAIRRW